jgi:uncharacterized membrane protein
VRPEKARRAATCEPVAQLLGLGIELAFRLLQDESARIREIDADRAAAMFVDACLHCLVAADARRVLALGSEARRAATLDARAYATMMLACALIWNGPRAKASKLLDRFLPILGEAPPLSDWVGLVAVAAQCYFGLIATMSPRSY